ncbi:hypothetical protein [Serratia liquefaciens]|uniref:hypothetical protein n=1 Tax=Serratia liquefaciens TaxID=614 RepID=UPI00381DB059
MEKFKLTISSLKNIKLGEIDASIFSPTGESSIGYPQISLRVNRMPMRTDLDEIINKANAIADKYPDDKSERARKVIEALATMFGSGYFGHAWVIIFNSEEVGDYSTYSYHEGFGYVHDGDTDGSTNDSSTRGFCNQICVKITREKIDHLNNVVIPWLNQESTVIGNAFGMTPAEGRSGVYTPLTNCSWFAGNLWNEISDSSIIFTQQFSGALYSERWGIDALANVKEISDPGVIGESLALNDKRLFCDYIFQKDKELSDYGLYSQWATLSDGVLNLPAVNLVLVRDINIKKAYAALLTLRNSLGEFYIYISSGDSGEGYGKDGNGADMDVFLPPPDAGQIKYIKVINKSSTANASFTGYRLTYWSRLDQDS